MRRTRLAEEPTILVLEYFLAGGGDEVDGGLLAEAFSILRSLAEGFKRSGFRVIVTLHERFKSLRGCLPEIDSVIVIPMDPFVFLEQESLPEYVVITAPESRGVLSNLVRRVEERGSRALNSRPESIELVSRKTNTIEMAKKAGLTTPFTGVTDLSDRQHVISAIKEVGLPAVLKPVEGVGSEGLRVLDRIEVVDKVVSELSSIGYAELMVQEYVRGVPASVSMICYEGGVVPISLNRQIMGRGVGGALSYEGGYVPLIHQVEDVAFERAKRLVRMVNGLVGYVGMDIVISGDEIYFMELNPRPTTSLVGLAKVCPSDLFKEIFEATVLKRRVKRDVRPSAFAYFKKVRVRIPSSSTACAIPALRGAPSPLFPGNGHHIFMAAGVGRSLREAVKAFSSVKEAVIQHFVSERA